MRRWMMLGIMVAAFAAHAQSAPQASDSWQRPASSSSVAHGSSQATTRDGQGAFRFKDDKPGESRFKVDGSTQRNSRGPQTICDSANAACKQERSLRSGQGH
ncbi:hypothetical protein [Dyella sp. 2RAB6]|uniref:hypothetical protein n=1 Tax=Dyella sp. 2RAB6 TaxID=3232992 RepID=UPI003F9133AC